MKDEIFFGEIPQERLLLNPNEVAARLKTARGYTDDTILRCEAQLRKELVCGYTAVLCDVRYRGVDQIDLGFGFFRSASLYKNLNGVKKAYVFAVTVGYGVDRLIAKLAVTSAAACFVTDALASAFAEAACDYAEAAIKGNAVCRPRFSPGYGDLSIEIQPHILEMVSAGKRMNITINKSFLMSPSKSITAIMGIVE